MSTDPAIIARINRRMPCYETHYGWRRLSRPTRRSLNAPSCPMTVSVTPLAHAMWRVGGFPLWVSTDSNVNEERGEVTFR